MSPTMDRPRRALRDAERNKPTGRRRAQSSAPAEPAPVEKAPAITDAATPTTRAAERERERAAHSVSAEADAEEAGPGTEAAGEEPATVTIAAVLPSPREAITAAIPLQAAPEPSPLPRHQPDDVAPPVARLQPVPASAFSREPYAVLHKAGSVRHMSQRMAVVAGALGLALTVGTVGHALDLPFFGSESNVKETSGSSAGDATARSTASISGKPGDGTPASSGTASTGAVPSSESSDVSQAATVSDPAHAPDASAPSQSSTPTVLLAPPVWVPSAAQPTAPGTTAVPAQPVPAASVPTPPVATQPTAPGAPSDTVTTPPSPQPTTTPTPATTATTATPTPTETQNPSPAPHSPGQSGLGSLLNTVKKALK